MPRKSAQLLNRTLDKPAVFTHLLGYLGPKDVHALLSSSRQLRALFDNPNTRDIVLARLVPYYSANRHLPQNDISLSFHQLILFSISLNYPLHLYPALAPRTFQSSAHNHRFVDLTLAYSRLVLWLQARVHLGLNISCSPESPQPHIYETIAPLVPQLTFPEPLYFTPVSTEIPLTPTRPKPACRQTLNQMFKSTGPLPPPAKEPQALKTFSNSWRRRPLSTSSSSPESNPYSDSEYNFSPPRRLYVNSSPNSCSNMTSMSSLSRDSSPTPPTSASPSPPPSQYRFPPTSFTSPHDFFYASLSTRAPVLRTYCASSEAKLTQDSATVVACEDQLIEAGLWEHLSVGDVVCNLGHVPVDETLFSTLNKGKRPATTADLLDFADETLRPQPSRPHALNWLIYNGSYLTPLILSEPVPINNALTLPSPFYYSHILPQHANPIFSLTQMPKHCGRSSRDIHTLLSKRPTSTSVPHTFPSKLGTQRSKSRHSQYAHARTVSSLGRPNLGFGFSVSSVNQSPRIDRDQRKYDHKDVELRLVNLLSRVPTLHPRAGGPGGYALVKRHSWITRVSVGDPSEWGEGLEVGDDTEMGPGWKGEWILEGQGTREGRDLLVRWLDGMAPPALEGDIQPQHTREQVARGWRWELVRERCSNDRIWLRLLENVHPRWIGDPHDDDVLPAAMDP